MKTTGITRRIDELGRIVIPKEIRKNMHIKPGELLEIYLSDAETIVLKKHSLINNNQEFINCFIKSLSNKIHGQIWLTNLDEITFSSNENVRGLKISEDLERIINGELQPSSLEKISLANDYVIEKPFDVYPVSPNGDIAGLLIISYNENLTDEEKSLIKFSTAFLKNYLEEI